MSVSTRDLNPAAVQRVGDRRRPGRMRSPSSSPTGKRSPSIEPDHARARPVRRPDRRSSRRSAPAGCAVRACRPGRAPAADGPRTGPGNFWKNHHGTPFCSGTTTVSSSYSDASRSAISAIWCALSASTITILRAERRPGRRTPRRHRRRALEPSGSTSCQPVRSDRGEVVAAGEHADVLARRAPGERRAAHRSLPHRRCTRARRPQISRVRGGRADCAVVARIDGPRIARLHR